MPGIAALCGKARDWEAIFTGRINGPDELLAPAVSLRTEIRPNEHICILLPPVTARERECHPAAPANGLAGDLRAPHPTYLLSSGWGRGVPDAAASCLHFI